MLRKSACVQLKVLHAQRVRFDDLQPYYFSDSDSLSCVKFANSLTRRFL
jgi:hypothetical protein